MNEVSNRQYPYYAGREKYRGKPKGCECCGEPATHSVTIQQSIFRGDDDAYLVCEGCAKVAREHYDVFASAVVNQQAYLSKRIDAQHEETGRMWNGERRNLPPRYNELPPSESDNA